MPVSAHYNQIGVKNIRLVQNFLGHRAGRLMQCDLDTGLNDFSLPLSQLRFLSFILWNWLRHGIKYWNRNARHRGKLGHARQAVAKRSRRCGCTQFFDVNEMDLRIERFGKLSRQIDNVRRHIREIDRHKNMFHIVNLLPRSANQNFRPVSKSGETQRIDSCPGPRRIYHNIVLTVAIHGRNDFTGLVHELHM